MICANDNTRLIACVKVYSGKSYVYSWDSTKFKIVSAFYFNAKVLPVGVVGLNTELNYTSLENTTGVYSFTSPKDAFAYFYMAPVASQATVSPSDLEGSQIELGTTPTEYEPYKGKTYTIQLGNTIYGGELDVITGELRVAHGEVDLGDLDYIYESSWGVSSDFYTNDIQNAVKAPLNDSTIANAICSQYKIVSRNTMYNSSESAIAILTNGIMKIRDSRYTSASDFKTAVTGQTLVYELATPYTIQLTPQQIRMLKGTNHLNCNTGDLSIKYYPDNVLGQLKGDIEKGLNAYYEYQIQALWDKIEELQA